MEQESSPAKANRVQNWKVQEILTLKKNGFQRQDVASTDKDGRFKEGQWGTVQSHLWGTCGSDCEGIVKVGKDNFNKNIFTGL